MCILPLSPSRKFVTAHFSIWNVNKAISEEITDFYLLIRHILITSNVIFRGYSYLSRRSAHFKHHFILSTEPNIRQILLKDPVRGGAFLFNKTSEHPDRQTKINNVQNKQRVHPNMDIKYIYTHIYEGLIDFYLLIQHISYQSKLYQCQRQSVAFL